MNLLSPDPQLVYYIHKHFAPQIVILQYHHALQNLNWNSSKNLGFRHKHCSKLFYHFLCGMGQITYLKKLILKNGDNDSHCTWHTVGIQQMSVISLSESPHAQMWTLAWED